jgi:phosphatidylinositol 4-kinase
MIQRKQARQQMLQAGAVGGATPSAFLEKAKQIQRDSPYGSFQSYRLRAYIVKSGDDMRQEALLIHFVSILRDIFFREKINVFLMDLDFILLSKSSAMIEFIPDSNSVSGLKKTHAGQSLLSIYKMMFSHNFHEAQKNFVESLAGYALFCYLFQVKDRHNSNIMVDSVGHLIHIDFGFCLAVSPGNMGFETAPFKFTAEYLELMGGAEDYMYYYFRTLLFKAFEVLKKHVDSLVSLVEIMRFAEIPCFHRFDPRSFEARFHPYFTDQQRWDLVDRLLSDSFASRRTALYDQFQKYSNDIEY